MKERNIAAIATPPGKGGVAIVRISGDSPLSIAEKMFVPSGKTAVKDFRPYRLYPGEIDGGTFTDYGLCVYFKAPPAIRAKTWWSFTVTAGRISPRYFVAHLPTRRVGSRARGVYQARFSQRKTFPRLGRRNRRHDQRGIGSGSQGGLSPLQRTFDGKGSGNSRCSQRVLAGIDAAIDYPEEGIEEESTDDIRLALQRAKGEVSVLLSGYAKGKKIKSGVTVALCGKPNTGKSSLLNRLLGYEKAIVSDIAGTTRDAVEGVLEIDGVRFNLYDTAGVRESGDEIENIGIERAENIVRSADLVVFVADSAAGTDGEDARVLELAEGKPLVMFSIKLT